ncbi:MAG: DUF456 domain-containing protein [Paludibacteraceae bacterium]|nr:DUF456 domain-containing protein [Paludibacteraceae bacterium]
MEIGVVLVVCLFLVVAGLVGSVIPGLPGTPLYLVAMLIARFCGDVEMSNLELFVIFILVAATFAVDFFLPMWTTKKFGGTKAGVYGSIVGLLAGLFLPIPIPGASIICMFLGAIIGEYIAGQSNDVAVKSGMGNLIGFIVATTVKFVLGVYCGWRLISFGLDLFSKN